MPVPPGFGNFVVGFFWWCVVCALVVFLVLFGLIWIAQQEDAQEPTAHGAALGKGPIPPGRLPVDRTGAPVASDLPRAGLGWAL